MSEPILTNCQELETWLDQFMAEEMEKLHIPGVTFSVVQNGEVLFAKGYGYADLEQKIPVVADRTLFRVGSISKLFTATAIMQLLEQELLNLDDDVNQYLPNFQLKNNYPQPVTIANLLTHTAGFDERLIGVGALETKDIIPLGEYLAAKMPARILNPGREIIYSNHGYALLGYIVEVIAGMPFSQYIDENILQPLEMNHSSFALPSHLESNLALSYRYKEKQKTYQALPLKHIQVPPAGALNATATDIANFALAHLQDGRFKSQRILATTTAQLMQQQKFTHDSRLPGMCLGFMELTQNKQRGISHGGSIYGFRSLLHLFPQHNLGLFISDNGGSNLSGELLKKFSDRYFPIPKNPVSAPLSPENRQKLLRYQGSYRHNRYGRNTLEKTSLLFSSPLRLQVETDGTLSIPHTLKTPNPVHLQEIEPLVLQIKDYPDEYMIAQENDHGKITNLVGGFGTWKKLAWYEKNIFHWLFICLFVLVSLSGLIVSVVALTRFPGNFAHQLAQLLAGVTCGLNMVFVLGMLILKPLSENNERLQWVFGIPKITVLLLCIPLVTSLSALGLPIFAVLPEMNHQWLLLEQLHYILVAICAIGLIPFLNYWNLLGFRY